ncbi:peptidylprolyl isomerase [uncultured Maritalea sp.]|jgi:peptidylprolyl isomerase|uniref:peptidylprolyl isomerase n=1 Tax=uncultured Maritalea sp. TaxID=757249 RepID=UPI002610188B|nr:peptidylprolyl isomerase [uncultured Maritalea sp.]
MSETPKKNNQFVSLLVVALLAVAGYLLYVNFKPSAPAPVEPVEYAACETPKAPDGVKPVMLQLELKTGDVLLELRPDLAPLHVARLESLAKDGFYNGIVFHRVIDGFMAQTGDPTGTGMGGSDLPDLPAEFTDTPYQCGTIGMARSQNPDSANSQFFITFDDANFLDGQYTVLGFVRDGMEHIHQIKKGTGQNGIVTDPDKMISLKVLDR